MRKKLFFVITVLLPLMVLIHPYLRMGVPYTHDGENHLARFANYKVAIREGQIPPRFAPNLMNHYGYPVFNYNYPLLNVLSLPLSIIGVHYELTFKFLMIGGLLLGAWGVVRWLAVSGFPRRAGLFAAGVYLLAPFTVNLVFVRGNIGEVWALALFPWLLWLTKTIKQGQRISWLVRVLLITAFMLSHNVSVLFGGLLWFFYTLKVFGRDKTLWKTWFNPVIVSILLSLWFWLPAVAEKEFIVVDDTGLNTQFAQHFVQPLQLINSPLQFGYSFETAVDTISLSVGLVGFTGLLISTFWLLRLKRNARKDFRWLWFFIVVGWVLLFLQTNYSYQFWRLVPLASFIQFPWRLTLFFIVLVLPLVATIFTHLKGTKLLLWVLFFIQLLVVWRLRPVDYLHKTREQYDLFPQSTSTLNENLPKDFTYLLIGDWQPTPFILEGQAVATATHWAGSNRKYHLSVTETALVVEPTMYFPGWETTVNSQLVEYVDRHQTEGRLGYRLEPGEYDIKTRFTQKTWPRVIGNSLSMIALVIWGWLLWREKQTS